MDGQNYGAIQQFLANQGARRVANFQAGSQAVDHGMTNFLYRLIFGPMSRPGDGSPGALAQSFNPLHPAGLVNDLSMFVGGGKDMPEGFAKEMPGQFERYSLSKSPVRMQEGQPHDIHALIQRANSRASQPAAKMVHDLVFGGEVHAKGPIPSARLNFNKIREQAITEREKTGAELDAMGAKRLATDRILFTHGFSPRIQEHLASTLDERARAAQEGQGRFRDQIANNNFFRRHNQDLIPQDRARSAETVRNNDRVFQNQIMGSYKERPTALSRSASAARKSALDRLVARHLGHHMLN